MAGPLVTPARQAITQNIERSKDIHLEALSELVIRQSLERALLTLSRVVHDHVDRNGNLSSSFIDWFVPVIFSQRAMDHQPALIEDLEAALGEA